MLSHLLRIVGTGGRFRVSGRYCWRAIDVTRTPKRIPRSSSLLVPIPIAVGVVGAKVGVLAPLCRPGDVEGSPEECCRRCRS